MKKCILILLLTTWMLKSKAQTFELQQLILDIQKLSQMKQILSDMKTGYEIVSKGYSTVRDIAKGNLNLHEAFLNGLWLVSPTVRKYWKIPVIINDEVAIVKGYTSAYSRFKKADLFNPGEIQYICNVYSNLLNQSLKNITDLTTVITADQLRMSDAERLQMIDRIYTDMQNKITFLSSFNNNTTILGVQRAKEKNDTKAMQEIYGLP